MKLLLDENMPFSLARQLISHDCSSVTRLGWSGMKNGKLLAMAESKGFDVLITLDDNIPAEQNFTHRKISVLILKPDKQGRKPINELTTAIETALQSLAPGSILRIGPNS